VSSKRRTWYGQTLFGNVPTVPGERQLLEPYLPHMLAMNTRLEQAVGHYPVVLSLDISGFYENVQHQVLLDIVRQEALLGPLDQWLLEQLLHSFAKRFHDGPLLPQGLPQSYPALSALLAEIYLLPLDTWLQQLGVPYMRYIDDFRVLVKEKSEATATLLQFEEGLRRLGLSFSREKTGLYDGQDRDSGPLPLMGTSGDDRLPEDITAWAGISPSHEQYNTWQADLRAYWETHGAPRQGRPFRRTTARFCLSRLRPDPALLPDVVTLLREQPHEYDAVSWYLRRVRREHLPWQALRAALPEQHHALAAAGLLRAMAPDRHPWSRQGRPTEVNAWLQALQQHPDASVRLAVESADKAWGRPELPPLCLIPACTEQEVAQALAMHLELPVIPEAHIRLPHITAPNGDGALRPYQVVNEIFPDILPRDGQNLQYGHVLNMVGRLNVLRAQNSALYPNALLQTLTWLDRALPEPTQARLQYWLSTLTQSRTSHRFTTWQAYRNALTDINTWVFIEVQAAYHVRAPLDNQRPA